MRSLKLSFVFISKITASRLYVSGLIVLSSCSKVVYGKTYMILLYNIFKAKYNMLIFSCNIY